MFFKIKSEKIFKKYLFLVRCQVLWKGDFKIFFKNALSAKYAKYYNNKSLKAEKLASIALRKKIKFYHL